MHERDADLTGRLRRAVEAVTATLVPPGAPAARHAGEQVRRRAAVRSLVVAVLVAVVAVAVLAALAAALALIGARVTGRRL